MKLIKAIAAGTALTALAACSTVEETVTENVSETYTAYLVGSEVPGGGDADGYARAEISVSDNLDRICWEIDEVRNVTPTAAHIHQGVKGATGGPVLELKAEDGMWTGCSEGTEALQNGIEAMPSNYYVQIHSAQYPNGAIRGQLYDRD
ncbi:CHRD domain-containing protein [Sphingomicrobium sp. XHP0235]|uniref:CHRD domain-containing protein n=1 Tax=Sphingomicrobium aquimarinum TaxID=3133971 RepID=UPI0031FECACA